MELPQAYLAVVDGLPDMALLYDEAGLLRHANPSGLARLDQLGLLHDSRDLSGVDLTALVAPADQPALRKALAEAMQGRATPSLRLTVLTGGAPRAGSALFNPLVLDGVRFVQVLVRDVTARVTAERAIALSEARLQATFSHSPIGLAIVEDGRFAAVNPALCALLGRTSSDLVGLTADDITHPEDLPVNDAVGPGPGQRGGRAGLQALPAPRTCPWCTRSSWPCGWTSTGSATPSSTCVTSPVSGRPRGVSSTR